MRLTVGVKVPVKPVYPTDPGIEVAPCVKVKVAAVIVAESIVLLKVALTFWLIGTPVAAFAGTVKVTVGAAVSVPVPVVLA